MKINEFGKFLLPFDEQITNPTCDETEFNWANYLLSVYLSGQNLIADTISIKHHNTEVDVIRKSRKFGSMTNLVIRPFPGLLLNYYGEARRPLLRIPFDMYGDVARLKIIVESEMDIDVKDPGWYIQTLIKMICKVVNGPFDSAGFAETLNQYQAYRDSGGQASYRQ